MSKKFRKKMAWVNPAQRAREIVVEAQQKDGFEGVIDAYKSGDVTDPGGWLHNLNEPVVNDPGAAPTENAAVEGNRARDRIRRKVYRAQGRSSTIKVSPSAAPFNAQGKSLLGQ